MADDQFQLGSGNWWDCSRNRFESAAAGTEAVVTAPASVPTTLNAIASFGWPAEMVEMKARSSMDSATPSGSGGGVLGNPNQQMMELGLSSQSMDWNQAFIRGEKADHAGFRCLLQEDLSSSSSSFQQESGVAAAAEHWRQKLYSGATSEVDSAAAYGLLLAESPREQRPQSYQNRPMNYSYPSGVGYGSNAAELTHTWNKYPPFLRTSPPKQQQPPPPPPPPSAASGSHLHFTNNTPFWNASTDARSSFFPALQNQIPSAASSFEEKPKQNTSEIRDSGSSTTKKNSTESSSKRPRNESSSPLPAFKVRKEKMGDRITALQQLVSPFGKTDTASVLSEAIEYIKFLHEQISVLTTPYMKNGAPQHQQNSDKLKDPEGPRQDLQGRGLCLVPVSSTFPVTHETTVDFWTPTFGGSFR